MQKYVIWNKEILNYSVIMKLKLFGEDTVVIFWGKLSTENYVKKVSFPYYCFFYSGQWDKYAAINGFGKVLKGITCFKILFWSRVLIFLLYLSTFLISHISFKKNNNACICINKLLFLQIYFIQKQQFYLFR